MRPSAAAPPFPLLPYPGGVEADVGRWPPLGVEVPAPGGGPAEHFAGGGALPVAQAGVHGGAADGGLGQARAGHLLEEFGPLTEAVADGPREGGQALQGRGEVAVGQAGVLVEGAEAVAAAAAVVVGAGQGDGPQGAQRRAVAVAVVASGLAAAGAGQSGPVVAVFLSRRCSW